MLIKMVIKAGMGVGLDCLHVMADGWGRGEDGEEPRTQETDQNETKQKTGSPSQFLNKSQNIINLVVDVYDSFDISENVWDLH